jgi:O-antigen ligase
VSTRAAARQRPPGWRAGAAFFLLMAITPVVPYIKLNGVVDIALNDFPPILAAAFGLVYVATLYRRRLPVPIPTTALLTAPIALIAAASAAANGLLPKDLLGGPIRWTETTLLIVLAFVVGGDPDLRRLLLRWATLISTGAALIGIAAFVVDFEGPNYLGIEPFRSYQSLYGVFPGRITSTLGVPSSGAAGLFALTLPIAVGYAMGAKGRARIGWLFCASSLSVALLFTFGRVSTALGLGLCVLLIGLRLKPRVAVSVGIACLVVVLGSPINSRFLADSNDRAALWSAALSIIKAHPWLGVGPTQYEDVLPLFQNTSHGFAGTTAHNSVLEAAATMGFLAGILLTLAIVVSLATWVRAAMRRRKVAPELMGAWLGLTGFVLTSLTVNFFFWPQLGLLYWTMAMALSRLPGEPVGERPVQSRAAVPTEARRRFVTAGP